MSQPLTLPSDVLDSQQRLAALLVPPQSVGRPYSADVQRTLARCHPEVEVRWHVVLNRFWLVQRTRTGRLVPFRMLGTIETPQEPTIENTVHFVAQLAAIKTDGQKLRWLQQLDESSGANLIEKDARACIAEGAREMYPRLFHGRTMVPFLRPPPAAVERKVALHQTLSGRARRKRRR